MAAARERISANPMMASVWGGIITAIPVIAFSLLVSSNPSMNQTILALVALIFTGVGPVLGYQLAGGRLGGDWLSIIAGLIGTIVPLIGHLLLWPILVGAMSRGQSVGKLLIGSILSLILAVVVFGVVAQSMGQDPANMGFILTLTLAVWGGGAAAFMASGSRA